MKSCLLESPPPPYLSQAKNHLSRFKHLSLAPLETISMRPKQVVTCFLIRDSKLLVLQRGKKDAQYRLWGIPGGKLEHSESRLDGLKREIFEETGAQINQNNFIYLDSAESTTTTEGKYGLHLYFSNFPSDFTLPIINLNEHISFQWVSIDEFPYLDLLHAQKEAFQLVEKKLRELL